MSKTFQASRASIEKAQMTPYWPTAGWRISTPEAQGMDSAKIADMFEAFQNRNVHSIVIIRNGFLVAEAYNRETDESTPQDVRSITKSFTSTLTGIALNDHKLKSVNQRISEFFPQIAADPLKSKMMIKHLLSMTSGLEWTNNNEQSSTDMMYSPNWIQHILERPAKYKPGVRFNYSNGDAHLLSAVLHEVTGESLFDYAKSRLFKPLGITNVNWNHDPQGCTIGAWAMAVTARDMAKLGYLYLMEGMWEKEPILSKSWIKESLTTRIELKGFDGRNQGYGYYWWTKLLAQGLLEHDRKSHEMFYAAGSGGPRIFVVPDLQLIVTITSQTPDGAMPEQLLGAAVRSIRSNRPLAPQADASVKLHNAIEKFKSSVQFPV